jgi:hypothetical protein
MSMIDPYRDPVEVLHFRSRFCGLWIGGNE